VINDLPAALALEVDALCDDFERHWRRSRRRGTPPPGIDAFLARATPAARPALLECLREALPDVPGLAVEEEIGRGGMGVVYRARRLADGRAVALKLIPGAEHARWSRWLAGLADLRHPNLVPLEAFGTHDGLHYVVMPLVPGGDLKERLGEFLVGPGGSDAARRTVAQMMMKVADAVDFLHRRGILHRDLKPSNILLSAARDPEPLVCDFGLAGRLDDHCPDATGVAGTPRYMAPEQKAGRPLTAAADIWSLGAVLHELLTGQRPGVDANGADDDLHRICAGCLGREPETRYPSAAGLADELRRYLETLS
jgi:serine/threonine-protein kinase